MPLTDDSSHGIYRIFLNEACATAMIIFPPTEFLRFLRICNDSNLNCARHSPRHPLPQGPKPPPFGTFSISIHGFERPAPLSRGVAGFLCFGQRGDWSRQCGRRAQFGGVGRVCYPFARCVRRTCRWSGCHSVKKAPGSPPSLRDIEQPLSTPPKAASNAQDEELSRLECTECSPAGVWWGDQSRNCVPRDDQTPTLQDDAVPPPPRRQVSRCTCKLPYLAFPWSDRDALTSCALGYTPKTLPEP